MTVLRDEYREYTTARMKGEVGTGKLLHGADLGKLSTFAQDRVAWAALVSHTKHKMKVKWVQKDGERKGRQVPSSHTPAIRVRVEDIRVQRRDGVVPRLLTFDEVEDAEGEGGA